jgi:hypothetical protein
MNLAQSACNHIDHPSGFSLITFASGSLVQASGDNQVIVCSVVLILSCVPMTLSSVYKEMALGDRDLDPIFLNLWVAVYQVRPHKEYPLGFSNVR